MSGKIVHCWIGNQEYAEEKYGFLSDEWYDAVVTPSTCMLPDGHKGSHVFTPDSKICIRFKSDNDE